MSDKTFESLVSRIAPSVPGCPTPTIVQYIRHAAIRTCERTLAWRYQQPLFDLVAGAYIYTYRKPADSRVHAVFRAFVNDTPMEVLTLDRALDIYPKWADKYTAPEDISEHGSDPRSIVQLSPHQFAVLPLPGSGKSYSVRMFYALKPTTDAAGMPEDIFDELEEVITHGALQQLLLIPGTNWSDKELASYHAKQYLYQISERRARANLGNARGTMQIKIPSFGA